MDWRILSSTFFLIFVAELGDKTQLAALASAASTRSPWPVFIGACLALIASTVLAVILGRTFGAYVPQRAVHAVAGLLFLVFGVFWLTQALRGTPLTLGLAGSLHGSNTLNRLVLDAAAEFEATMVRRYGELAAATDNPRLRVLLTDLVAEERCHLAQVRELDGDHGEADLPIVPATPDVPSTAALELANGDRAFMVAAIEHERAVAEFYSELARTTSVAPLRTALLRMAEEETSHAERLGACLGEA